MSALKDRAVLMEGAKLELSSACPCPQEHKLKTVLNQGFSVWEGGWVGVEGQKERGGGRAPPLGLSESFACVHL